MADRDVRTKKTPPAGVQAQTAAPDVEFDDLTPPPTRIPDVSAMSRDEALTTIRAALDDHADSIEHEQRVRREAEQHGREMGAIAEKIGSLALAVNKLAGVEEVVSKHLVPGHDRFTAKMEELIIVMAAQKQRDEDMTRHMERLYRDSGAFGNRLGQMEKNVGLIEQLLETLSSNHGESRMAILALDKRTTEVETRLRVSAGVSRALSRTDKAKVSGFGAAAGIVTSIIAWLLNHFINK